MNFNFLFLASLVFSCLFVSNQAQLLKKQSTDLVLAQTNTNTKYNGCLVIFYDDDIIFKDDLVVKCQKDGVLHKVIFNEDLKNDVKAVKVMGNCTVKMRWVCTYCSGEKTFYANVYTNTPTGQYAAGANFYCI